VNLPLGMVAASEHMHGRVVCSDFVGVTVKQVFNLTGIKRLLPYWY
jgi:hypothetical protein